MMVWFKVVLVVVLALMVLTVVGVTCIAIGALVNPAVGVISFVVLCGCVVPCFFEGIFDIVGDE